MMSLEISIDESGVSPVLRVRGSVSPSDAYRFSDVVSGLMNRTTGTLGIDVTGIVFMESQALGILVSCFLKLRDQHRELVLINTSRDPNGYMKVLLESTRLDEVFRIIESPSIS